MVSVWPCTAVEFHEMYFEGCDQASRKRKHTARICAFFARRKEWGIQPESPEECKLDSSNTMPCSTIKGRELGL